ncbi:unnamed protein product [Hydatigera taeniaeformis]|uniref:PIH1 domain-containing protein 1 n=1 Tax=Hydatigena taeniaeformis TaxID=6205 RepID=A0A0R3X4C8_HYDTA|nr:unnamed protein product [Hydatigera taeniaeformis]
MQDTNQSERFDIVPDPGLCVKLKCESGELGAHVYGKVPIPEEITEESLITMLESKDAPPYRVPLSIGDAHCELDNAGKPCSAYDVVIHPKFLEKVKSSQVFMGFLVTAVIESLESKFQLSLCRGKRSDPPIKLYRLGCVKEQEMYGDATKTVYPNTPLTGSEMREPMKPQPTVPDVKMFGVPNMDNPEFIVAEFQLPKLLNSRGIKLDIGANVLVLRTRSHTYEMAAELNYTVDQVGARAEFNLNRKVRLLI